MRLYGPQTPEQSAKGKYHHINNRTDVNASVAVGSSPLHLTPSSNIALFFLYALFASVLAHH